MRECVRAGMRACVRASHFLVSDISPTDGRRASISELSTHLMDLQTFALH